MSLRLRLLGGLASLVLVGLTVFGAGTYLSLRHFLTGRLDQELSDAASAVARSAPRLDPNRIGGHFDGNGRDFGGIRANVGPDLFVEILDDQGTVLATVDSARHTAGPPSLSRISRSLTTVRTPRTDTVSGGVNREGRFHPGPIVLGPVRMVSSASGAGGPERVALVAQPGTNQTVAVAGSLQTVTQTLHRLLAVEIGVGGGVLAITLILGLILAAQATRPLEAIAETADGIAAGDLERRVAIANTSSEVGRVGVAINSMLTEIQAAFSRRDATESRLRRFVADASHELSTPLTSIRGYAELFHRGLSDHPEDLAKAMARIESEGARMGGLVDDLLVLASFDNGRPVRRDPVDLTLIASDAALDARVASPDRTVRFEGPGPVVVLGDEDRIRQVTSNLTSNARRHTPPGTVITVRSGVLEGFGVLEVVDDGPGLSADAAAHVFERFFRADKARSRSDGGAGLGLSIVATITEALGGRVELDTAPGRGATFRVLIPLAPS
ncbi:MAG: HAMP domain-containing sensor histidine kinase [Acidimicrobiales bacterium]